MRFCGKYSHISSVFLSVAEGTVGDVFPRQRLAFLMMSYTSSLFIGAELGPLKVVVKYAFPYRKSELESYSTVPESSVSSISTPVNIYLHKVIIPSGTKRWTFYVLLFWASAMLFLIYFLVPEPVLQCWSTKC
ncbi:hypothetical protein N7532_003713 [Penicillium argentinense]|uniref:Uncharacterized protein n=1 Tax=Penicillium argentinense TaxID=1131581 RepID=A0A9W9KE91_9EURO|nr:uncharacterized protein N7532_003713 [Penicillium argentinense]KAJ5103184.1 hypothetical protein N7532_003713 [Penicillium argentinense]